MRQRVVYWNDCIDWYFCSKLHHDRDLPARYCFEDGNLYFLAYCQHSNLHRTTGPAYIDNKSKIKEYWYQGNEYDSLEEMQMLEACK